MIRRIPLWEKVAILSAWLILMGGLFMLAGKDQSITGAVPAELNTNILDATITQSEEFAISSNDLDLMLGLRSFRVWGTVHGTGEVLVTLENNDGDSLIVYRANATAMNTHLTSDGITIKPTKDVKNGQALSQPTEIVEGGCFDTCLIPASFRDQSYNLKVEVEAGTMFKLNRVSYN
jgi:hypothetical protein